MGPTRFAEPIGYPFAGGDVIGGPEEAINQRVAMGDCFAFNGDHGNLTIRLERPIRPTAVTLEHFSPVYGAEGGQSAPKHFAVWGYVDEQDLESKNGGQMLIEAEYDINASNKIQTFEGLRADIPYEFAQLRVGSNFGQVYTCVYRFRVHSEWEN